MKTTDCILIEWTGKKFSVVDYKTINIALSDIYKVLQEQIASDGVEVSIEEIDRVFKTSKKVIRTEKGDYKLIDHLKEAHPICVNILKESEDKFGKLVRFDKIFTGGGADKFLGAFQGSLRNNIDVSQELRYYANSIGYYLGL